MTLFIARNNLLPSATTKWPRFVTLITHFLATFLSLVDEAALTDELMQQFIVRHAERLAPYYAASSLGKRFLKSLLGVWAAVVAPPCRVGAFLAIRSLCLVSRFPFLELAVMGMYLTFAR